MPLPSDEKLVQLSDDLVQQFDAIFGLHPGLRPARKNLRYVADTGEGGAPPLLSTEQPLGVGAKVQWLSQRIRHGGAPGGRDMGPAAAVGRAVFQR